MVWAHNKINRTSKDDPTGHGTSRENRERKADRNRWEDNILEWAGLKLGVALQKAENREEWRKLVARLSLIPQQSFRLRDRLKT